MTSRRRRKASSAPRRRAGVAVAIATLACGISTGCGTSQIAKVASAPSPATRAFVAGDGCVAAKTAAGANAKTPESMSGAQLEATRRACGDVRPGARGGPRLRAKPTAGASAIHLIAEFAACMRQNGVNVPAPTPARSDPQLDVHGINTRSSRVRAAGEKCGHYLRASASDG
jgi:hypothetical protein